MNSIWVVLAVCVADGYEMEQLDADTAFLDSEQSDRVCMETPSGVKTIGNHVRMLNKAIYGIKQASLK